MAGGGEDAHFLTSGTGVLEIIQRAPTNFHKKNENGFFDRGDHGHLLDRLLNRAGRTFSSLASVAAAETSSDPDQLQVVASSGAVAPNVLEFAGWEEPSTIIVPPGVAEDFNLTWTC